MGKKIVIVHDGFEADIFPLLSLIIGLQKAYPGSFIIWAGMQSCSDLVRYNKRVKLLLDISQDFGLKTLELVFGADICVNASFTSKSKQFASNVKATQTYGFTRDGAVSRKANFFENVISGKISTQTTLLQMYYALVDLRWRGEGYGLTYYPRVKQTGKRGLYLINSDSEAIDGVNIKMPKPIMKRFDTINRYAEIVTDDLFTAHASIALRKKCTLMIDLPYQMEFFGKGHVKDSVQ